MPEGHTLHRYARQQREFLVGANAKASSPQGRFDADAKWLDGRRIEGVRAWGKHLFQTFEGDADEARTVHIHLGLFGKFRHSKGEVPPPRGAVRLRLEVPGHTLDLNGPTCCERLSRAGVEQILSRLGPDPLREECSADDFVRELARRRKNIAACLLDQSIVSGIGNVYRAELLFEHRLHPDTPGRDLSEETVRAVWQTSREWLDIGVRYGKIITASPEEVGRPRSRMRRRERVKVYKRPACPSCGGEISKSENAARNLYWCPACQQGRR